MPALQLESRLHLVDGELGIERPSIMQVLSCGAISDLDPVPPYSSVSLFSSPNDSVHRIAGKVCSGRPRDRN